MNLLPTTQTEGQPRAGACLCRRKTETMARMMNWGVGGLLPHLPPSPPPPPPPLALLLPTSLMAFDIEWMCVPVCAACLSMLLCHNVVYIKTITWLDSSIFSYSWWIWFQQLVMAKYFGYRSSVTFSIATIAKIPEWHAIKSKHIF